MLTSVGLSPSQYGFTLGVELVIVLQTCMSSRANLAQRLVAGVEPVRVGRMRPRRPTGVCFPRQRTVPVCRASTWQSSGTVADMTTLNRSELGKCSIARHPRSIDYFLSPGASCSFQAPDLCNQCRLHGMSPCLTASGPSQARSMPSHTAPDRKYEHATPYLPKRLKRDNCVQSPLAFSQTPSTHSRGISMR